MFFTSSSPAEGSPNMIRGRLFVKKIQLVKKLHPHALLFGKG
jgi:hypothetical protein